MRFVLKDIRAAEIENNKVNLCDSCQHEFATCDSGANDTFFGDGKGNDNVCCCSCYAPLQSKRHRVGQIELKPCPFCGKAATTSFKMIGLINERILSESVIIGCKECGKYSVRYGEYAVERNDTGELELRTLKNGLKDAVEEWNCFYTRVKCRG